MYQLAAREAGASLDVEMENSPFTFFRHPDLYKLKGLEFSDFNEKTSVRACSFNNTPAWFIMSAITKQLREFAN